MTRAMRVELSPEAKANLVDPMNDRSKGTVLSVCAGIVTVKWDQGRTCDYAAAWLSPLPGKADLPEVKPKFDAKLSRGWKR